MEDKTTHNVIPLFERSNELMKGNVYEDFIDYKTFKHAKSVFNEAWYNFIIPTVSVGDLDTQEVARVIVQEKSAGKEMSYYIPSELLETYKEGMPPESFLGDDTFMQKNIDTPYEVDTKNICTLQKMYVEEYIQLSLVCFPEWVSQKKYTEIFVDIGEHNDGRVFKTLLILEDEKVVSFGSIIIAPSVNLAYLHNAGTHPNSRMKGYCTDITKALCNIALKNGVTEVFGIVEEGGGSYRLLDKLGFKTKEKFSLFSI